MSKISKRIIEIPQGVQVINEKGRIIFREKSGKEEELSLHKEVELEIKENKIFTTSKSNVALAGTYNSIIRNMINGITKGFEKILKIEGNGYKFEKMKENGKLKILSGKSHADYLEIPDFLTSEIESNGKEIKIKGSDKEKVNSFAAKIRDLKKPNSFKKFGIFYSDEAENMKFKAVKSSNK